MSSSVYDFEQFAKVCQQDPGRWDLFVSSISNVKFNVPLGQTIVVESSDVANLPGLAARYLGSRYLWYVLLHYNGLYDSINDMYAGMTLNIPQISPLLTYLKSQANANVGINPNQIII